MRTAAFVAAAVLATISTGCNGEPAEARGPGEPMWSIRSDDDELGLDEKNVTLLPGGGLAIKETANATLWHPTGEATAPFRLTARVRTTNLGLHPHGAGIVFGGHDIDGDKQAYTYFLIRGDSHYLVKTRDGTGTDIVQPWTEHTAITEEDSDLKARNVLSVSVGQDETRFLVNDTEVFKHPTKNLQTNGRYGVRTVHDLEVRFDNIKLTDG